MTRKIKEESKQLNARSKKNENSEIQRTKAIQKLAYWDEYRCRKAEVAQLYYQAKEQLARKRALVLMASFHSIITDIHKKYRVQHAIETIQC